VYFLFVGNGAGFAAASASEWIWTVSEVEELALAAASV
jgi:hypothetical protein